MAAFAAISFISITHISDSQLCPVISRDLDLHTSTIGWWFHRLRNQRHRHTHVIPSAYGTAPRLLSSKISRKKLGISLFYPNISPIFVANLQKNGKILRN
jgi:hypothetical protein